MYDIQPYTYLKAKRLGVIVKASERTNKKIDVYDKRDNQYITSVGDIRYGDYPTYIKYYGQDYADKRRLAFHKRFKSSEIKSYSNIYFSANLLW
jgi:hypothetical protein